MNDYIKARMGETSTARSAARLVALIGGAFGLSVSPEMAVLIVGVLLGIAEILGVTLPDNWADIKNARALYLAYFGNYGWSVGSASRSHLSLFRSCRIFSLGMARWQTRNRHWKPFGKQSWQLYLDERAVDLSSIGFFDMDREGYRLRRRKRSCIPLSSETCTGQHPYTSEKSVELLVVFACKLRKGCTAEMVIDPGSSW